MNANLKQYEINRIISLKGKNIVPENYYKSVANLLKSGYSYFAACRGSVVLK